jgi:AraC-like DNA-binding protein
MQTSVRAATLNGYVELAADLDLDAARLMRRTGLDPADVTVPDRWVSAAAVARLLDLSATASGRPDFAVLLAERRRLSTLGPLSLVLREEPDLRSVVTLLIRHEHSYNEALRVRLVEEESLATIRVWCEFGEPAPTGQALTLVVGALCGILHECAGDRWRPLSVCFSHPAPPDLGTHHRFFGPALRFGHEFTGLVLYRTDLDTPNALSDPLLRPYAGRILDTVVGPRAATTSGRVREAVEVLLPLGRCSIDQVARTFGVDRRTLQRHLADEGESFSGILCSTRGGLAEHHLAGDRYTMTELSQLLGFASPSAFSRWFSQEYGVSPREWRRASGRDRTARTTSP